LARRTRRFEDLPRLALAADAGATSVHTPNLRVRS
jgi:hypothetical protein